MLLPILLAFQTHHIKCSDPIIFNMWVSTKNPISVERRPHNGSIQHITFGTIDNGVFIYNPETGKVRKLKLPSKGYFQPMFSANGRFYCFERSDKQVRFVSFNEKGQDAQTFPPLPRNMEYPDVSASPNGQWVAAATGNQVFIFNLKTRSIQRQSQYLQKTIHKVGWSPDSKFFALTMYSNGTKVGDIVVENVAGNYTHTFSGYSKITWSPDMSKIAIYDLTKRKIIDTVSNQETSYPTGTRSEVWIDNETMLMVPIDIPEYCLVQKFNGLKLIEERKTKWISGKDIEPWFESANFTILNKANRHEVVVEGRSGSSDGGHFITMLVNAKYCTAKLLMEDRLLAVSPDQKFCAISPTKWIGNYKRGGYRGGPLTIVEIATGKKTVVTQPNVEIDGGCWVKSK